MSENIIGSAREVFKSGKDLREHEINEIVSGEMDQIMKKIINQRIASVKKISQKILSIKDV